MKKHIPIEVGLYNVEVLIRSLRHVQFFNHMYNILCIKLKKNHNQYLVQQ